MIEGTALAMADRLTSGGSLPGTQTGIERLQRVEAVQERLALMSSRCRREALLLRTSPAPREDSMARSRPLAMAALSRGVSAREVFPESIRNNEPSRAHLTWLASQGAHIRTVPLVPVRALIVDREVALVPALAEDEKQGALVVTAPTLVMALVAHFSAVWREGREWGNRPRRIVGHPTPQEHQALLLWARGCTDAAVARQLGVSDRTVRRISDTLSARLGSHSRFQLAVKAMEYGWITPDDLV